jgi:hypothetical protein
MKGLTITVVLVAVDSTGVVSVTAVDGAGVSISVTGDDRGSITVKSRVPVAGH